MSISIDIPDVPPSLNRLLRMHWAVRRKVNAQWQTWVWALIPHRGNRWDGKRKRVTITLHHSRLYDRDNAFGSVKPIVDALVHCGFIVDDSAEWIELDVQQAKCPHKKRHTEILLALLGVK